MTKRTRNLVTAGMAVSLFLAGLGIATYQGRDSARDEPSRLAESGSLDSPSDDRVPTGTSEEDDGCGSIVGRGEWPEEMSQAVIGGSRPGHADDAVAPDDASVDGSSATGAVLVENPDSPGTARPEAPAPPGAGHDQGGAAKEVTCPRGRDYVDSACPEL